MVRSLLPPLLVSSFRLLISVVSLFVGLIDYNFQCFKKAIGEVFTRMMK
jgi:hypothetical protein